MHVGDLVNIGSVSASKYSGIKPDEKSCCLIVAKNPATAVQSTYFVQYVYYVLTNGGRLLGPLFNSEVKLVEN